MSAPRDTSRHILPWHGAQSTINQHSDFLRGGTHQTSSLGMVVGVSVWSAVMLVLLTTALCEAARGGGGGRGGGKGGRGGRRTQYGSRMPILIQHRNPASANYYDHKDGARIVKSSHFELDYMLGRKITFFCMAQGLPRPHITWFKDGIELYAHKFFQVHEWPMGNDTMKSKMEIDPTTQKDAGYYECQADNQYAIDRRGFRTDYVIYTY